MEVVGVSIKEKVFCNKCGAEYYDKESIELVRKWSSEGYAPCPNLGCPGELELTLEFQQV